MNPVVAIGYIRKRWDILTAIAVGVVGWFHMPPGLMQQASVELVTFFSLQAAIIMPALIVSITVLKTDALSLHDFDTYHDALRRQMQSWVWFMAICYLGMVTVVLSNLTDWCYGLLSSLLLTFSFLIMFRAIYFVRGVIGLFDIRRRQTKKMIEREVVHRQDEVRKQSKRINVPEGYGSVVKDGA